MIKRLPFVAILALSMACGGGSAPTSPTPVVTTPPPTAAAPKVVGLTITASRDVVTVNFTSVLTAIAQYDDGTSAPITPTWETITGPVTLVSNGPVALVTGQGPGIGVITARAAGLTQTRFVTVTRPGQ